MKLHHFLLSTALVISFGTAAFAEEPAPAAPVTTAPTTLAEAKTAIPHWEYEGEAGASKWGGLDPSFSLCETGKAQSPIDIKETISADLPSIAFFYIPSSLKMLNNGHTIQANVTEGSSIKVGEHVYQLLQFHFHTPSEYQVAGKAYPLEVHFVHKRADGVLGVVGVMFEEGLENAELAKIWKNLPAKAGEEKEEIGTNIDFAKLLPADQKYFRFMGSLTSPPCSEGVNWHVMQQPVPVSKEQIAAFKALFPMNARPLQPSNNRLIVKDDK
jgi:carbonic anhydrase